MDETASESEGIATVEWRRQTADAVASPIVREVPYLELKLEHPELEATGHNKQFYPDSVPHELDDTKRIFYWQPALSQASAGPSEWIVACATTHGLTGIDVVPSPSPELTTTGSAGETVVVEGTVGGDATTAYLRSYVAPAGSIDDVSESEVKLSIAGSSYAVSAGKRQRIALPEQQVELVTSETGPTIVTPELVVRYPGRREIHHPAPGETYNLFPSFGLDVSEIPRPLSVPTTADELDDAALAEELGVDLTERPYPERVLWQAFSFTAFDPHDDLVPEVAQLPMGHIVVEIEESIRNAPR